VALILSIAYCLKADLISACFDLCSSAACNEVSTFRLSIITSSTLGTFATPPTGAYTSVISVGSASGSSVGLALVAFPSFFNFFPSMSSLADCTLLDRSVRRCLKTDVAEGHAESHLPVSPVIIARGCKITTTGQCNEITNISLYTMGQQSTCYSG
jgi:hypothetical protein